MSTLEETMYLILKQAQNKGNELDLLDHEIISTLFNRLEQEATQHSGSEMSKDISTTKPGVVEPKVGDLTNIDNFISWLGLNSITYKGQPIVLVGASNAPPTQTWSTPAPPVKTWGASDKTVFNIKFAQITNEKIDPKLTVPADTVFIPPGQEKNYRQYQGIYWVNPSALKSFLEELQRSAAKSNNNLFEHLVGGRGGLLEQVNALTPQLGVKVDNKIEQFKAEQKTETKPTAPGGVDLSDVDETTVVDRIAKPVILNNPREKGLIPLTIANLKSQRDFYDWINANEIEFKNTEQDKELQKFETTQEYCFLITYLSARSKMYNVRGDKSYQLYAQLMQSLSSAYGCQANVQPGQTQQQGQQVSWQQGQPLNAQMQRTLAPIVSKLPLLQDRIDIPLINSWVQTYQQLMAQVPNGQVPTDAVQNVVNICQTIMSFYGIQDQPLTQNAVDIYRDVRMDYIRKHSTDPHAAQRATQVPADYVSYLAQMLVSLERVLSSFKHNFYDSLPPDWKQLFDRQIDDTGGSLSAVNRRQVAQWINLMPAARQQVEKGI